MPKDPLEALRKAERIGPSMNFSLADSAAADRRSKYYAESPPIGRSKGRDTYLPPETVYTRKTNPFPRGGGFVDESGQVPYDRSLRPKEQFMRKRSFKRIAPLRPMSARKTGR